QRFSVVAGVLSDKDYANMMDLLMPFAARFFCLTPESPRALDSDELCGYLRGKGAEARSFHFDVEAAIEKARGYAEPILAVGSLYLAGKIRDIVEP
ncbi:MAG TPA: bifunctional folylpolyglutamate synthase/dihydrofolate synthase, partial [Bacillota bacterium]|nr:bifunctional folylpolyglutamate synthase/dihydrofolate synthase [Bacillota bacterium]